MDLLYESWKTCCMVDVFNYNVKTKITADNAYVMQQKLINQTLNLSKSCDTYSVVEWSNIDYSVVGGKTTVG